MNTKTQVIIINGAPRSGKDTFVNLVSEYCKSNEFANVFNISSVEPIKEFLKKFGWDDSKSDDMRDIISKIKAMWEDNKCGSTLFMVEKILNIHKNNSKEDNIIFCHIREPKEIERLYSILHAMHSMAGDTINVCTLIVKRNSNTVVNATNPSDNVSNIESIEYEYNISNDGTINDLAEKAGRFVDEAVFTKF